ncbi:hypothetical protein GO684_02585 [Wolbachia endosymbiont of Litomosoides brasiliensis]|uniref:hypothetical protein n=1 Tax=Wolbachia endosymbiont of Litomosoides brasiliensis TaxID=1812117 RepID=UPI00158DE1BE|nr:hypothetical protein [Wolbachia endosymbiont of Litomosoides brasiliensis]NUY39558.1 hypothetical protein [Wolbachia endosymbiont of Litomosoides brasiliensis]
MESAKEMLKEVRNNAYVAKKLNAIIAAKRHSTTAVAKLYLKTALTAWIKHLNLKEKKNYLLSFNIVEKLN